MNKRKIFNDPVYGFISIPFEIIYDIIEHPYFQRLRRINQLGLSSLVYPGANHSRFQHTLGAVHLMGKALEVLRNKGHQITNEEAEAVTIAILLHDIGHGPYSHTLEQSIVNEVHHEQISLYFFEELNKTLNGRLSLAIKIFKNDYPKRFLNQLVSGQLDVDRLDYLIRDSFYTGVAEGVIGYDRIIQMLDVHDDNLVVEEKGIYSIEKFIVSRRLMYWQVYLHKTSLSAEHMMVNLLERAKFLARENGVKLPCSEPLRHFLEKEITLKDFASNDIHLKTFALLDDHDIMGAIKSWAVNDDILLSYLSKGLLNRRLFKIEYGTEKEILELQKLKNKLLSLKSSLLNDFHKYLIIKSKSINNAYNPTKDNIYIKYRNGNIKDISEIADMLNIKSLSNPIEKHYLCYSADLIG
ncbi:MAG: HD domain-containing protein [Bacteroidetes bacterium]|nr:HD domain-containing protein [Bacteroidota bacterium]